MSTQEQRFGEVQNIIAELFGISPDTVSIGLKIQDIPEWDSINHMNLVLHLEKEYGIPVNESSIVQCTSVSGILQTLSSQSLPRSNP
ncbi:MAG: acyl carrier protein [Proteobacteria bacterium]|nr:acyl carrier protein [Pseudomonadota bacterium]